MFRRQLRSLALRMRDWLSEDPTRIDFANEPTAIPWLNAQHKKIVARTDGERRPNYAWGVLQGAHLAATIGIPRISVLEFGVAGGNGLISLELIAADVESLIGVGIDVYGFDTGSGLPEPLDYRDLPNVFSASAFPMDVDKLRARLTRAQLLLGDVSVTVPEFIACSPAPIAFVSLDLDLYSSTAHALRLFDAPTELLVPRVHCYFDDILGVTYSDFTGERLAIREFNATHESRKIGQISGLRHFVLPRLANQSWVDAFYLAHIFDHDLYNRPDGLRKTDHMDLVAD